MPTREGLLKHWSVVEAFRNGKKVQYRSVCSEVWKDIESPTFTLNYEYRIKPEPQEVWVNIYASQVGYAYTTREHADRTATFGRIACVKVTYTEGEGL